MCVFGVLESFKVDFFSLTMYMLRKTPCEKVICVNVYISNDFKLFLFAWTNIFVIQVVTVVSYHLKVCRCQTISDYLSELTWGDETCLT